MQRWIFKSCLIFLSLVFSSSSFGANGGYPKIKEFLNQLVKTFPEKVKLVQVGASDSGEIIEGVAIGNGPVKNLVVATHHGNEYGSTEVAKAFANALAEQPILGQTMYVIPVLNISGYNANRRWEMVNGRYLDANRDYPGPCGTSGPFKLKSTNSLAKFVEQENVVSSATLHTYYPAVVYPWGISSHDISTPHDGLFTQLVEAATVESHYQTGNSTQVIYPADGTFEDYAYWKHGIWSILFEVGYSHSPSEAAVKEMIRVNVPGLRRMFEQAPGQRADKHEFEGKCDSSLKSLDRHDE